jgi:hypothetical protein
MAHLDDLDHKLVILDSVDRAIPSHSESPTVTGPGKLPRPRRTRVIAQSVERIEHANADIRG